MKSVIDKDRRGEYQNRLHHRVEAYASRPEGGYFAVGTHPRDGDERCGQKCGRYHVNEKRRHGGRDKKKKML